LIVFLLGKRIKAEQQKQKIMEEKLEMQKKVENIKKKIRRYKNKK